MHRAIPILGVSLLAVSSCKDRLFDNPLDLNNSPPPNMVLVQGGTFHMGSIEGAYDEQPIHSVTLTGFYMGKCEVTQAQWKEIVQWKQTHGGTSLDSDPSILKGDSLPVDMVSWDDVRLWIGLFNEKEGSTKYRLPTEAEWEYAARGGTQSNGYTYSGSNTADNVGWHMDNSGYQTHPVAKKRGNELGIYDMSGNVSEWCQDWYGSYASPSQTNPTGPSAGTYRVNRGGLAFVQGLQCTVARRSHADPSSAHRYGDIGFRLVRTL